MGRGTVDESWSTRARVVDAAGVTLKPRGCFGKSCGIAGLKNQRGVPRRISNGEAATWKLRADWGSLGPAFGRSLLFTHATTRPGRLCGPIIPWVFIVRALSVRPSSIQLVNWCCWYTADVPPCRAVGMI